MSRHGDDETFVIDGYLFKRFLWFTPKHGEDSSILRKICFSNCDRSVLVMALFRG